MNTLVRYVVVGIMMVALIASVWHGTSEQIGAATVATPTPDGCTIADDATPIATPDTGGATPVAGELAEPLSLASFLVALEAQDLRVETEEPIEQSFFNAEQVTRLVVTGGPLSGPAELQVYEYADVETFATDVSQVTPDGNLKTVMITWIATPHFYCSEQLIVIYLGDDQEAIDLLTELFGPQFAGR